VTTSKINKNSKLEVYVKPMQTVNDIFNSKTVFFSLQLALPQLVQNAQFPFNFATGAAAPHMTAGFYYPQPMTTAAAAAAAAAQAAAQSNYLQGLQGYTFNNFGASYPQSYIR
jgi:hypothetical protein